MLLQLRCSGIFEAVKIRQSGYPFRLSHQQFYNKYRCCSSLPYLNGDFKDGCELLLKSLVDNGGGVLKGSARKQQVRSLHHARPIIPAPSCLWLTHLFSTKFCNPTNRPTKITPAKQVSSSRQWNKYQPSLEHSAYTILSTNLH
jgi:hypothetical protein